MEHEAADMNGGNEIRVRKSGMKDPFDMFVINHLPSG